MINVVPYIETVGTEKFKEFLSSPFKMEMLETIFKGWEKDPKHDTLQQEYTNGETIIGFCFEEQNFTINRDEILPFPKTINDFIVVTNMFGITLYWSDKMLVDFEPKDMYSPEGIKKYFTELLEKMDKSHELM